MLKVETIISALKSNVKADDTIRNIAAGTESMDPSMLPILQNEKAKFIAGIESSFRELSQDGVDAGTNISTAQIESAKAVAIYAASPMESLTSLARNRKSVDAGAEDVVVDTTRYMHDYIPQQDIIAGVEAFDGQVLASSLHFSIAYNALAIKQDPVAELFYPVVVVDPSMASATVKATVTSILTAIKRDISGRPTQIKRESLVKKLNDTELFTVEANKLYPVVRPENADALLNPTGVTGLVETVTVQDGIEIETAPIVAGKKVDLLGLSQTDELIAAGVMDETDSLNGRLAVSTLVFSLTGADVNGTPVTEYHSRNIVGLPAIFTYTPTAHNKDMQLDYKTESLAWNGGSITKADGTPTAIATLAGLTAGYTVRLGINLKGDANAQSGNVAVYPVEVYLVGLFDANGVRVDETSQLFADVKAVFDTADLKGYVLDAYASNSNARFRGKRLTTDTYTYIYTIPTRTVFREQVAPVKTGDEGDTGGILAQIDMAKRSLSKFGLLQLNETAAVLENLSIDTEDYGISSKLVNKYMSIDTLDLSTVVDSIKSNERESDITGALLLAIKNAATAMYGMSNYNYAFDAVYPGVKPTVIIGTDTTIGRFISSFEDELFKYEVRVSGDSLMVGKIFLSFGVMGADRNKEANPLNYGVCFWSPEMVISLQRSDAGKVVNETITMPRFLHQTLMPVLSLIEVSGLESVSGKLPINFKTV